LKFFGNTKMQSPEKSLILDTAKEFGLTKSELLSLVETAPKRYYVWKIPKKSGGDRVICHPARELKAIQRYFVQNVLNELPVHSAAMAYVVGRSIKENAKCHAESRVVMKLDFEDFFNNLVVENWEQYASLHFPPWSIDEIAFTSKILFWGAGSIEPVKLAIGAPTSPLLSNCLLFDVDTKLSEFAASQNLNYTRYADDITFSSKGFLDFDKVMGAVKSALSDATWVNLRLNAKKTRLASKKTNRRVTGIVITSDNKVSLGRERKRKISSMVHYGIHGRLAMEDYAKLGGLIAFAIDVEPSFVDSLRKKYGDKIIDKLLRRAV
jgi:RNA-directed DNA polymerase